MDRMRSCVHERHPVVGWEVARPDWRSRVPGVTMAGFDASLPSSAGVRIVPHPSVMLILEFGAGLPALADAGGYRRVGSLVAGTGFGSGHPVSALGANVECVQVRLSPLTARAVLGVPAVELDGAIVSLDDLWGSARTSGIRDRLSRAGSWTERFEFADALLANRYAKPGVDREVAWAWRRIVASRGTARVESIAAELGWSRKRLWSRFRDQIGLAPKSAAKLVRFDRATHRLVAGHDPGRVAAAGGYADQSHLYRDVAEFTGMTPTAVAGEPFLQVDDVAWPDACFARAR